MQQLLTTAQEQTQAFKADCEQRDKKLLEAQEEMEKVRSSQSQEASAEAEKLRTQCADLEKQCAALKDQLAQAQEQAQAQAKAKAEAVSTEDANSWKAQLLAASDQLLASQKQVPHIVSPSAFLHTSCFIPSLIPSLPHSLTLPPCLAPCPPPLPPSCLAFHSADLPSPLDFVFLSLLALTALFAAHPRLPDSSLLPTFMLSVLLMTHPFLPPSLPP